MFYQLIKYQKVPLSVTLKEDPVIEDLSLKQVELIVLLLDTLKMEPKPDSDYQVEPEKLLLVPAELPSELLPEVAEPINLC